MGWDEDRSRERAEAKYEETEGLRSATLW